MVTKILDEMCSLTGIECRHCSQEVVVRPYTNISLENGHYVPKGQGRKICEVGQICNTAPIGSNPWIDQMNTCPVKWAVARYGRCPVGEKKTTKKKVVKKKKPVKRKG
jgi:hypothetical protein